VRIKALTKPCNKSVLLQASTMIETGMNKPSMGHKTHKIMYRHVYISSMLNLLSFLNTVLSQPWLCEVPQGFFYCCCFHVLRTDGTTLNDECVSYGTPYDILHSAISHHTLTAIHQTFFCVLFSTVPQTSLCFCKL
jgi:hypothetical protein